MDEQNQASADDNQPDEAASATENKDEAVTTDQSVASEDKNDAGDTDATAVEPDKPQPGEVFDPTEAAKSEESDDNSKEEEPEMKKADDNKSPEVEVKGGEPLDTKSTTAVSGPDIAPEVGDKAAADPVASAQAAENQAPAPATEDPQPHGRLRKLLVMVFLPIIAIVILGGAVFGGYVYYQINRPENVVLAGVAHTFDAIFPTSDSPEITSFKLDGMVEVEGDGSIEGTALTFSGAFDVTNQNTEIKIDTDLLGAPLGAVLGIYGEDTFFKVTGLDVIGLFLGGGDPAISGLFSQLNDQWIQVENEILDSAGLSIEPSSEPWSDADLDKLEAAFLDHRFLEYVETLDDEELDGTNNHHFKVRINNEELVNWVKALADIGEERTGVNQDLVNAIEGLANSIEGVSYDAELWVGKDDKYIRRLIMNVTEEEVTTKITMNLSAYNQDQQLGKPEGAIPFSQLLLQLAPLLETGLFDVDPTQFLPTGGESASLQDALSPNIPTSVLGDSN